MFKGQAVLALHNNPQDGRVYFSSSRSLRERIELHAYNKNLKLLVTLDYSVLFNDTVFC
jgi:hypothetical protein